MLSLAACLVLSAPVAPPPTGDTLRIVVEGIATARGEVLVAFYDAAERFNDPAQAALILRVAARAEAMELAVPGLAPGRYAVAVLHDEDANGEMTTQLFGIPKEAYGFSNGARGTFGPPAFDEAVVECTAAVPLRVEVK